MNRPDPERREELLDLAEQLAKRLASVDVPYLGGSSAPSSGVPASVLSHATSYLARVRDTDRFRELLTHFDQLDGITAQNPDNPKADHRVVREELEAFLAEQPALAADDLLYLLSWVRRLLPRAPEQEPDSRGPKGKKAPPPEPPKMSVADAAPIRGGQLAAALEKARLGSARRSGDQHDPPGNKSRR